MRTSLKISVLILFLLPLLTTIYKTQFLGLTILPKEISDEWNLQLRIDPSHIKSVEKLILPIPLTNESQDITSLNLNLPDHIEKKETKQLDTYSITLEGDLSAVKSPLGYSFRARTKQHANNFPKSLNQTRASSSLRKYLDISEYSKEDSEALTELSNAIIDQSASTLSSIKKIFFYVSEEIRLSQNTQEITESLALGLGSTYTKAKIFNFLARSIEIPSRIGAGIQLEPDAKLRPAKDSYKLTFFNEIYLNNKWYRVDLQKRVIGELPKYFVVISSDIEQMDLSLKKLQGTSVFAVPLKTNRYDSKVYSDELKRSDSIFYTLSLYSLPLSAQASMYVILLLPIGAVVISLFRNIVGFSTFGIFTPALLTVFFIETQFTFAFIFFVLVIFLGFFQRILLDKLYLLAVPRISILLTFVIIAYILFILLNQNVIEISSSGSGVLSYFPVVIITILIERFSIDFIEEGSWNTFKKLAGTVTISFVCYFILTFKVLQQLLFANPEFLLWTIAINILIGNYKGYRVSEFFRFKELSQKVNA